ncbi:hypothetical protein [Streptomyces sp. NPDC089919]|uniref:hypothetical protein n=1 Tax=Streptomyces sp. NPDC089919 TaxID=3155188 RepID=UPI00341D2448
MTHTTQTAAGPGMRRVLGRIGRCVLTYAALHMATWVVISLVVPWDDSFAQDMRTALGMLALIGGPTLLLAVVAGLAHTSMAPARFRTALAFPMVFFIWPLLGMSTGEPLVFQFLAQVAFAAYLMPAPLVPENWTGRPA